MTKPALSLGLVLVLAAMASPVRSPAQDEVPLSADDPWSILERVRAELLSASPIEVTFVQTFVPNGFASGDEESGALYLDLPTCLRWQYGEPFPKDFLLCGDWVYTWNPDEASGRRFLIEDGEAEGMDLLRLEIEGLRQKYRATVKDANGTEVVLEPLSDAAEIRQAAFVLGEDGFKITELSYEDQAGNRTAFSLSEYRPVSSVRPFEPPDNLEWIED